MYHLHATLTEDLLGAIITASASRHSGRRQEVLAEVTWFCEFSDGISEAQHAEIAAILDKHVSELSTKLRRVFPGVFFGEAES